jgi:DNA processing protein
MFDTSAPVLDRAERAWNHRRPVSGSHRPDRESTDMHHVAVLSLALAAARHGPGPVRLAALARATGVDTFLRIHDQLSVKEQERVARVAQSLARKSVFAVLMGSEEYPARLLSTRGAPAFLFCRGLVDLLTTPGLAVCGSRTASASGVAAARACAQAAADLGLCTIAGHAPGVGLASHVASLRAGGRSVVVAAEGINRFRVRRGKLADAWNPCRTLVVSPFAPHERATYATETTRQTVGLGLGRALLVIEPRETGKTLAAGMRAVDSGRPVLVFPSATNPRGTTMLLRRGAIPIHNPTELTSTLDTLPDDDPRRRPLLII